MRRHPGSARGTEPGPRTAGLRIDLLAIAVIAALLAALPAAAVAAPFIAPRAYELVSPAKKNGNDISDAKEQGLNYLPMVSPDGTRAGYTTWNALPGSVSNGLYDPFEATRGEAGWLTDFLAPPMDATLNINFVSILGFSEDLGKAVLSSPVEPTLTPDAARGTMNMYLRDNATGAYRLITVGAPENELAFSAKLAASSPDLGHVVISTANGGELTPDTPVGISPLLYDWSAETGELSLVGKAPNGTVLPTWVEIAWPPGTSGFTYMPWNPVSADGSRILFTTFSTLGVKELYQRVDDSSTIPVSESQRSTPDPVGEKYAEFRFASTAGTKVFFTSKEKKTDDATTGPGDEGEDLYLYDTNAGTLTDLTVDGVDVAGAQVQGVLGGSNDGSRLYFVANGVLAPGATAGQDNLYVWSDEGSAAGTIEFIADEVPDANWKPNSAFFNKIPARVTPDGSTLLFVSNASPTGYPDGGHYEGYLYDAASGQVVCATCNPSGATATADALPVGTGDYLYPRSHPLTDDGQRVFFTSQEKLAPGDDNAVADVYEFDAETGRTNLVSSGKAELPSEFTDATPSGSDVLFVTRQQLVGVDRDQNVDVYDARVGGGFAWQNPLAPAPPCVGSECRGTVTAAPAAPAAASSQQSGPGNQKPRHKKKKSKKKKHKRQGKHRNGNRHGRR